MNKLLGFSAVIIMLAAMGYLVVTENNSYAKDQTVSQTKQQKKTTMSEVKAESLNNSSEKTKSDLPDVQVDDWNLVLVGPTHKLTKEIDETNQLVSLDNGYLIDKRIKPEYEEFAQAAQAAGFPLVMVSAYRSVASQEEVFAQNVQQVMASQGVTQEEATNITKQTITEPGYSEHHTGLAIDVVDQNWYNNYPTTVLDASYGNEPGAKWIAENAANYGFIVRYLKGREDVTNITYEPWHLRYVGKENAMYMVKHGLTLEEYLDQLKEK
ncbi:D-alanyl-D-alanine carboxypeptidase family protein [Enterococcus hirae]|nr:D-alanyl-D-alanine carboxypeptidase family protein [Enterococcus hirae]